MFEMLLIPGSRNSNGSVIPVITRLVRFTVDVRRSVVLVAEDKESLGGVLNNNAQPFVERIVQMSDLKTGPRLDGEL